ncbi:MAG: transglutaminase domain-containing protein [Planctomycetota bacterium]
MLSLLTIALLFCVEPSACKVQEPKAEAPLTRLGPALEQKWVDALASIDATQRPGLEFLLEHMPASDRATLEVELVLENVAFAYQAWQQAPWHAQVSEEIFLNEILPYANINERRDRWRKDFYEQFAPLVAHAKTPSEAAAILNNEVFPRVGVIYSTKRPKADQSPYESIDAGMASCTGLSVLLVDACRSVGVPARFVGTPLWADGSGNHSWVEVWDDGWHFTGAAEPTGDRLNEAWFTERASQAQAEDRERAIYAVSFKRTPLSLPMVWKPDADTVYAINVTQRYLKTTVIPDGHARLQFRARDASGARLMLPLQIKDKDGKLLHAETTRGDSFDANDHLTFFLPVGELVEVQVQQGHRAQSLMVHVPQEGALLDFHFDEAMSSKVLGPRDLLWQQHVERMRAERTAEMKAKVLEIDGKKLRFDYKVFGEEPEGGHSLYISMHGGGGAPAEVNDQQWENQKRLYEPTEGIYLAPRASTDTWNLWHQSHIDALFDRLIENLIALEGVNPDRIYVMGYSAGGDGVYQLAPRMADRWAAAAMMAGHPNDADPSSLRNLPFTLHMGAEDGAYDRNKVAAEWGQRLAALEASDPGAYVHHVQIHEGKGHWMEREDAVAVPWMAQHTRNLRPQRIVWQQDDVVHDRFYWLKMEQPVQRARVVVERDGNTLRILEAKDVSNLSMRLDDTMVDFSKEIVVLYGEEELFRGLVGTNQDVRRATLRERGDPRGIWDAEVRVMLPQEPAVSED